MNVYSTNLVLGLWGGCSWSERWWLFPPNRLSWGDHCTQGLCWLQVTLGWRIGSFQNTSCHLKKQQQCHWLNEKSALHTRGLYFIYMYSGEVCTWSIMSHQWEAFCVCGIASSCIETYTALPPSPETSPCYATSSLSVPPLSSAPPPLDTEMWLMTDWLTDWPTDTVTHMHVCTHTTHTHTVLHTAESLKVTWRMHCHCDSSLQLCYSLGVPVYCLTPVSCDRGEGDVAEWS